MKDFLLARWSRIPFPWQMLLLFFVFEIIASGRVFVEMQILVRNNNLVTAIHRFLWYTYVFLFFAVCYRRILHVPFERLMYLAFGGIILFIPPIYAALHGGEFQMNYLVSRNPWEIARELLTLHYRHEENFFMFPELLVLLVGTIVISWYFSRRVFKTLLNTVVAFYGAFLTAGLCWFSVEPHHEAVWRLTAMFHSQQFYAFQFLSGVVILSLLLFLPEIVAWIRGRLAVEHAIAGVLLIVLLYAVFLLFIAPRHDRSLALVDLVVLFFPFLGIALSLLLIADHTIPMPAKVYAGWFALIAIFLVTAVWWGGLPSARLMR